MHYTRLSDNGSGPHTVLATVNTALAMKAETFGERADVCMEACELVACTQQLLSVSTVMAALLCMGMHIVRSSLNGKLQGTGWRGS